MSTRICDDRIDQRFELYLRMKFVDSKKKIETTLQHIQYHFERSTLKITMLLLCSNEFIKTKCRVEAGVHVTNTYS